jgi:hypothetical protein
VGRGHSGDCRRTGACWIDRHASFATRFSTPSGPDRCAQRTEVDHVENRTLSRAASSCGALAWEDSSATTSSTSPA